MGLGDFQAVGLGDPGLDDPDLEPVLHPADALGHQEPADPLLAGVGVDGQPAEFPDQVGVRPNLQVNRGRPDDPPNGGVLGDEHQAALRVNQPGQERLVIVTGIGVVGPVGRQEDLAGSPGHPGRSPHER